MALDDKLTPGNANYRRYSPTTYTLRCSIPDEYEYDLQDCAEKNKHVQSKQLESLKEDLAEWLNKTLDTNIITGENFLYELDNGVLLCHLAQLICINAKSLFSGICANDPPTISNKCFEKAKRRSFFSRDNMEKFINFCRSLGVHENLLFESDDLVLHNKPRNVILCLLEVARIASSFGVEPPNLAHLEKMIATDEHNHSPDPELQSLLTWKFKADPNQFSAKPVRNLSATPTISQPDLWTAGRNIMLVPLSYDDDSKSNSVSLLPGVAPSGSDGIPSDHTEDDYSRDSADDNESKIEEVITELDKKIQQVTRMIQRNCGCGSGTCLKLKIRKISEGKYNIAGKNVFVRLLKGNRMMVRVGGGWESLDHFLMRHDPCRSKTGRTKNIVCKPVSATNNLGRRASYQNLCSPAGVAR